MNIYEKGWSLGETVGIQHLSTLLKDNGFVDIQIIIITDKILPSAKLMAEHAQMRLQQDANATEVITLSRKACVEAYSLINDSIIGYFFIKATKDK